MSHATEATSAHAYCAVTWASGAVDRGGLAGRPSGAPPRWLQAIDVAALSDRAAWLIRLATAPDLET
jgi:hypothetical protein